MSSLTGYNIKIAMWKVSSFYPAVNYGETRRGRAFPREYSPGRLHTLRKTTRNIRFSLARREVGAQTRRESRSIPARARGGRIGRVNVGAARHDKLNRPCHSRSSAYWSALTLGKWSRFHLPPRARARPDLSRGYNRHVHVQPVHICIHVRKRTDPR